jgi:hypothetical protein
LGKRIFLTGVVLAAPGVEISKETSGSEAIFCPREEPYIPLHHDELPESSHGHGPVRATFTVFASTMSSTSSVFGTDTPTLG